MIRWSLKNKLIFKSDMKYRAGPCESLCQTYPHLKLKNILQLTQNGENGKKSKGRSEENELNSMF